MGGDCTGSACENRFRRIKQDAKAINAALKDGVDPITLKIGESDGASSRHAPQARGGYNTFIKTDVRYRRFADRLFWRVQRLATRIRFPFLGCC
jgi:hypothetical protein